MEASENRNSAKGAQDFLANYKEKADCVFVAISARISQGFSLVYSLQKELDRCNGLKSQHCRPGLHYFSSNSTN
eukprot:2765120-Amphidinium_carterae.1